MNYIRTEVTEAPVHHEHADSEHLPGASPHGASAHMLEQLLRAITAAGAGPQTGGSELRSRASSGLAPWQALRVRDYVETTLSGAITVGCLAGIAKLSTSHFARAFRASFGMTPAAYVVARRVERAKLMMLGTTESLCRISLDCGFTDQSHLSRAFRRQVGQSPSHWRRWHRLD